MLIFELLFSYIYIRHQSASETMFCLILFGSLACHIPDMYFFFALLRWILGRLVNQVSDIAVTITRPLVMVLVDNLCCLRNNIENLWQSEKRKTILALVFCCTNKSLVIQKEEFWITCVSRIWGAIEDILLVYSIADRLYREKIRNKKLYLEKACYILQWFIC